MNTEQAYDQWAAQYDTDRNRTRDLEAVALRKVVERNPAGHCLEIGCGTGKNTEWLVTQCAHVTAVDFSAGMLARAKEKVTSERVHFHQADILQPWTFVDGLYDLVVFSLVLEHIADLDPILLEAGNVLKPCGLVYIGELHPFKQYGGTKARFGTDGGTQVVPCFDHHISDFTQAARRAGLHMVELQEYFDDDDRSAPPRLLVIRLVKPNAGDPAGSSL